MKVGELVGEMAVGLVEEMVFGGSEKTGGLVGEKTGGTEEMVLQSKPASDAYWLPLHTSV